MGGFRVWERCLQERLGWFGFLFLLLGLEHGLKRIMGTRGGLAQGVGGCDGQSGGVYFGSFMNIPAAYWIFLKFLNPSLLAGDWHVPFS